MFAKLGPSIWRASWYFFPRLLSLSLVSLTLFAGEEVIASFDAEDNSVALESGRVLHFADDLVVHQVIDQMEVGDTLSVEGKGVVVVFAGEVSLFADEETSLSDPIEAIELFGLPRTGSRWVLSLLRQNLPKTPVSVHPFAREAFADTIRSAQSLGRAREILLGDIECRLPETTLAVISIRAPRPHLESLYRTAALPFKSDIERGFTLFLNGAARLPNRINVLDPLTNERCSNPLQVRQLWLLRALFVQRSAHKNLIIDFDKLRKNPAELIAHICAKYGCLHAPYFKEARLDTSGKGPYRPAKPFTLTKAQEMRLRVLSDRELEKHFGFGL